MFGHQRDSRRWWKPPRASARWLGAATATLALMGGAVVVAAPPAYAASAELLESFDNFPYTRWSIEPVPETSVMFGRHPLALGSDLNLARVDISPHPAVSEDLAPKAHLYSTIKLRDIGPAFCQVEMWLYPVIIAVGSTSAGLVEVFVRDGGVNGPVLYESHLRNGGGYPVVTVKQWRLWTVDTGQPHEHRVIGTFPWRPSLTLSIKVQRNMPTLSGGRTSGVLIDNLKLRCVAYPR